MTTRQIQAVLLAVTAVGCAAPIEDVGSVSQALTQECSVNEDCPGTHPTCESSLGVCVACTGDLSHDFQVDGADQTLFDSAFSSGDMSADIDRNGSLAAADQTLLDAAEASNDCVCDPTNDIDGAYTHVSNSTPSPLRAGYRFEVDLGFYAVLPVSRLLPFVTTGDFCGATVITDDGSGGPAIERTGTGPAGETLVTVYWKTHCSTPGGFYDLGLMDRITGRPVAEGLVTLEVQASSCGGGGGGGGKTTIRLATTDDFS